jgi:hypothetical protein
MRGIRSHGMIINDKSGGKWKKDSGGLFYVITSTSSWRDREMP